VRQAAATVNEQQQRQQVKDGDNRYTAPCSGDHQALITQEFFLPANAEEKTTHGYDPSEIYSL
jgi:hypothetical protein